MIISGRDLEAVVPTLFVSPESGARPAVDLTSVQLRLGNTFLRYKPQTNAVDLPSSLETEPVAIGQNGQIDFPPGCCLLASTLEWINMPLDMMGFIQTKGTIARGFVTVHLCDGQVDPGFRGSMTLELVNLSQMHYRLRPGIVIAQLFLHRITSPLRVGYAGRYQAAEGPTAMRP